MVGRDGELARLRSLIDRIGSEGSAVVLDGDAGVGKTTLVDAVARYARDHDVRVLRTAGSTAESGEQYAALQLLLHPLRAGVDVLPPPQRSALEVAFRSAEGEQPSPLLAGLAALTVVSDAAAVAPLLLVVEDLHWIDPESQWALRMLARRVGQDPVVVLMTTRERPTDDDGGLARMHLGPLSAADADALLDALPRPPLGAARRALLELAQGNPLALVELTGRSPESAEDGAVTRRLETAFAERFADLDQPARLAVLAIALGGTATAEDAGRFVDRALGRYPDPSWIDRAVAASLLVWSDRSGLRFRHPLVQTAVANISRPSERAAVLRALVQEHASDPVRTLWWRSELATGPDAELAAELAAHARSALATGDPVAAARASERAAELTGPGPLRVERLLDAADHAGLAGRTADAALLVQRAATETTDPVLSARAAWIRETLPTGRTALARGDLSPALAAVRALEEHGAVDLATAALLHLASIAWDHNRVAVPGTPMLEAVHALALPDDDPRSILLAAVTEPLVRGDEVVERVLGRGPVDPDDPEQAWWLGYALNIAGEFVEARERLEVAVAGLRARGDLRILPQALLGASMSTFQAGRLDRARTLAEEAVVLGRDLGDAGYATAARACVAWFDGIDGVPPDREAITAGSATGAHVLQSSVMRANLQGATAVAALLDGRPRDAREALRPLLDADGDAYNPNFAVLTTHDYVDAAVATESRDLVELHAERLTGLQETWHGPILVSALGYTETALALDADPGRAVQRLREQPIPMPYVQARALLLAGDHLRRAGRTTESRTVLLEALALFERLPAPAWARRTREVLRASGERLPDAPPSRTTVLTPQELRICTLANTGLTNRAIAQQLFLSPRTVGAHLYSAYRKLGIGGRAQLAAVFGSATADADTL